MPNVATYCMVTGPKMPSAAKGPAIRRTVTEMSALVITP